MHDHTDEFFLVVDGQFDVALREDGRERPSACARGTFSWSPRGTEHKQTSPGGAILMFEPSGTLTTGDRNQGEIPGHVDSAAGRELGR